MNQNMAYNPPASLADHQAVVHGFRASAQEMKHLYRLFSVFHEMQSNELVLLPLMSPQVSYMYIGIAQEEALRMTKHI